MYTDSGNHDPAQLLFNCGTQLFGHPSFGSWVNYGLGSEARMNTPATVDGNWKWQLTDGRLNDELAERLREMTELFGRIRE